MRTGHITTARRLAMFFVVGDGFGPAHNLRGARACFAAVRRQIQGRLLAPDLVSPSFGSGGRAAAGIFVWAVERPGPWEFAVRRLIAVAPGLVARPAASQGALVRPPHHDQFGIV